MKNIGKAYYFDVSVPYILSEKTKEDCIYRGTSLLLIEGNKSFLEYTIANDGKIIF